MARSCGLRIGPRRFELVVLDGSPRKHRITAFQASEFPLGEDAVDGAVRALRAAAKEHSIPYDNVGLVVDGGLAAFRTLRLPFEDRGKIEQVLKFEIESQLPQWSIDDVVVDFLPLEKTDKETLLIATAVQKSDLRAILSLCDHAGIEPLDAELETTAMVNAALAADVCHVEDAQVLVHIGELSTSVVVMDAAHVSSMRAIHVGAHSWEPVALAAVPAPRAAEGEPEEAAGEPAPEREPEDPEVRRRHLLQTVTRLRRELGRTLSGARTVNPIEAIYVCGIELPELVGSSIMDIPIYVLDVFEEDSGQPADGTGPLVVAYGAALRYLGGVHVEASLRREDLRYTGAFEKVELPLAIAALVLVTWASVFWIFENFEHMQRKSDVAAWLKSSLNYLEGNPAAGTTGFLEYLHKLPDVQGFIDTVRSEYPDGAPQPKSDVSPLVRMQQLDDMLADEVLALRRDLGDAAEIAQPQSALEGMTRVLGVLGGLGEQVGRFSIRKIDANYERAGGTRPDQVRVALDLTFFADSYADAVDHFETFQGALEERGWTYDEPRLEPLEAGDGAFINRFTVLLNLALEPRDEVAAAEGQVG